jgi:hypothetical protein
MQARRFFIALVSVFPDRSEYGVEPFAQVHTPGQIFTYSMGYAFLSVCQSLTQLGPYFCQGPAGYTLALPICAVVLSDAPAILAQINAASPLALLLVIYPPIDCHGETVG